MTNTKASRNPIRSSGPILLDFLPDSIFKPFKINSFVKSKIAPKIAPIVMYKNSSNSHEKSGLIGMTKKLEAIPLNNFPSGIISLIDLNISIALKFFTPYIIHLTYTINLSSLYKHSVLFENDGKIF